MLWGQRWEILGQCLSIDWNDALEKEVNEVGERRKPLKNEVLGKVSEDGIWGWVGLVYDKRMNMTSFLVVGQKEKFGACIDRSLV